MEWAVVNRGRQDTTWPEPARWGIWGERGAKAATAPAGGFGGGSGAEYCPSRSQDIVSDDAATLLRSVRRWVAAIDEAGADGIDGISRALFF